MQFFHNSKLYKNNVISLLQFLFVRLKSDNMLHLSLFLSRFRIEMKIHPNLFVQSTHLCSFWPFDRADEKEDRVCTGGFYSSAERGNRVAMGRRTIDWKIGRAGFSRQKRPWSSFRGDPQCHADRGERRRTKKLLADTSWDSRPPSTVIRVEPSLVLDENWFRSNCARPSTLERFSIHPRMIRDKPILFRGSIFRIPRINFREIIFSKSERIFSRIKLFPKKIIYSLRLIFFLKFSK